MKLSLIERSFPAFSLSPKINRRRHISPRLLSRRRDFKKGPTATTTHKIIIIIIKKISPHHFPEEISRGGEREKREGGDLKACKKIHEREARIRKARDASYC